MISRNLTRRLEDLEARLAPAGEPWTMTVRFIDKDGNVTSVREFTSVAVPNDPNQRGRPRR